MKKINESSLIKVINELVFAIRDLKENECKNSGLNWFDNLMNILKSLRTTDKEKNKNTHSVVQAYIVIYSTGEKQVEWHMPSVQEKKQMEKYGAKVYECDILIKQ